MSGRAPDADALFTEENRISGNAGRRATNRLARLWAHLTLFGGEQADATRSVTIMNLFDDQRRRLELQQTRFAEDSSIHFREGQQVHVIGWDEGVSIGSRGCIEKIDIHPDFIAYIVALEGAIYRQERRDAFRVPMHEADDVRAKLYLSSHTSPLVGKVRDLSMTGCRLELDSDGEVTESLESELKERFAIEFSTTSNSSVALNEVEVAWTRRSDSDALIIAVYWINPEPEFAKQIRRFVMEKERDLIKRRAYLSAPFE